MQGYKSQVKWSSKEISDELEGSYIFPNNIIYIIYSFLNEYNVNLLCYLCTHGKGDILFLMWIINVNNYKMEG